MTDLGMDSQQASPSTAIAAQPDQTDLECRIADAQQISAQLADCGRSLSMVLDRLAGDHDRDRAVTAPTPVPEGRLAELDQTQKVALQTLDEMRADLARLSQLV